MSDDRWDWIVIGSGFGGSVSALRLVEKGYRVLLVEKGRRFAKEDFADTNWDVKNWMWNPMLGLKGIFQMSFLKHVTILHGVGYGGGSLTYANTLPRPKDEFFAATSWSSLGEWKDELAPHYDTAERMLGAAENPVWTRSDELIAEIAEEMGRSEHHHKTTVGVFFGESGRTVADPYFDGDGPDRTGCTFCGACMTGCKVGAKNTLDLNYLHLAERKGLHVITEREVTHVSADDGGGYVLTTKPSLESGDDEELRADRVVFAGGVMGTIPLLLRMKESDDGLPRLSDRVGDFVRTNSEAIFGAVAPNDREEDFSHGVAITSILHTDEHSHVEPVRYGEGSGIFRLQILPHAPGASIPGRVAKAASRFIRHPLEFAKAFGVEDFAKQSQILLYMRTLEGTLRLRLKRSWRSAGRRAMQTELGPDTEPPQTFMAEATDLLERLAKKIGGVPMSLFAETLFGVPTTAHILGGACMGATSADGVIDAQHRVHGYDGLYVIDGAAMSANPGVNPSLTITAMAERAMTFVPDKGASDAA
jgi:cholesterol oxidase